MSELVFEKSYYLGLAKLSIYTDKLVFKTFLISEITIPLNQIASITSGAFYEPQITIETTGGEKIALPAFFNKKSLKSEIEKALEKSKEH
ncbi:MAG TPA: hypothetical protein P5225_00940 [Candidatus Paceibacterota bacterium]|jgi:hypothetical protein|nr:hypothetical protein [Candidatus Paceibacterota bacterium]